jgi:hypothetical protein
LLHSLGTLPLGNARTGESRLDRLSEDGSITQRDEGLKFFARDAPIIDRQIDAMDG